MLVVFILAFVVAFSNWSKESQFKGFRKYVDEQRVTMVIRNGIKKKININKLLVGDIVYIESGDLVPADGLIFQANDLFIDESSLTGESGLVEKDTDRNPIILSGHFKYIYI